MESNYYPESLRYRYNKMKHGRAKAEAIRCAIEQADLNNDIPYMVVFRADFCNEAMWYADEINIYTVFPELLSLIDSHPGIESTGYRDCDIMKYVLDIYGGLVVDSSDYYQIPFEDCVKFQEDFKKRWISAGYNASLPYRYFSAFYRETGNSALAAEFFKKFKNCPPEPNDCIGCITNSEIAYYLYNNEKEKADMLAEKIENGTIRCSGAENNAFSLMRMETLYIEYYIIHGDYENAAKCADVLESKYRRGLENEFNAWDFKMCAYVYSRPRYGLDIYKNHWKEWEEERTPYNQFYSYMCAACFFKGIKKQKNTDTVKISTDSSFPLYNGNSIYKLDSLIEYYYNSAEEIAGKFDKRNRTSKFTDELNMSFANVL